VAGIPHCRFRPMAAIGHRCCSVDKRPFRQLFDVNETLVGDRAEY